MSWQRSILSHEGKTACSRRSARIWKPRDRRQCYKLSSFCTDHLAIVAWSECQALGFHEYSVPIGNLDCNRRGIHKCAINYNDKNLKIYVLANHLIITCLCKVMALKDWCPSTIRMSRLIQAEVLRVLHIWGMSAMLRIKPSVHQLLCCSRETSLWVWDPKNTKMASLRIT